MWQAADVIQLQIPPAVHHHYIHCRRSKVGVPDCWFFRVGATQYAVRGFKKMPNFWSQMLPIFVAVASCPAHTVSALDAGSSPAEDMNAFHGPLGGLSLPSRSHPLI